MKRPQTALAVGLFFTGFAVITYLYATIKAAPLGMFYRDVAGFATSQTVAQLGAFLTVVGALATGLIVALPAAMRPGGWAKKLLYVIPLWLVAFTIAGVVLAFVGIGRAGKLDLGAGLIDLVSYWLFLAGLLATIAVAIAAARMPLSPGTLRRAVSTLAVTLMLLVVTWLALAAGLALAATNEPSLGGPGGGGPPGAGAPAGAPGAQPGAPAAGAPAQGQAPGGAPAAPGGGGAAPGGRPPGGAGAPGAGAPPGGGGPGRPDPQAMVRQVMLYAGLMLIFAVVAVWAVLRGRRALQAAPAADEADLNPASGEGGRTVLAALALTAIVVVLVQLVPVPRDNPTVVTPPAWDTVATKGLWDRACADCHSNETKWPWYAYLAPTAWLTAVDVHNGRRGLNVSQFGDFKAEDKEGFPQAVKRRLENASMPPKEYLLMHPLARLTDAEKKALFEGYANSQPSWQ